MTIRKTISGVLTGILLITSCSFASNISLNPEVIVPELRPIPLNMENITEVPAYGKGEELFNNVNYSDVTQDVNRESIYQLASEGVIKSFDNTNFSPSSNASKQDVLTYLVRMQGNEAAVQTRLTGTSAGMNSASYQRQLKREYIEEALILGTLIADEDSNLSNPATREEVAVWISRALGLAPIYGDQNIVNSFSDFGNITPLNRGLVEAIINEKIMDVDSSGNFNPKETITLSEVSKVLGGVTERLYGNRNITKSLGIVVGVENSPSGVMTYTLKKMDGSLEKLTVTKRLSPTVNTEIVTYKNGLVGKSDVIAIGDELEYLIQDGSVFFAKILPSSTIIKELATQAELETGVRVYYGTVYSKKNENHIQGDKQVFIDRLRVQNHNGQVFDFIVETDIATGIKNDINVIKDTISGGSNLLNEGDAIEYIVKDGTTLLLVKAKPLTSSVVKGNIQSIDVVNDGQSLITVLDYYNNVIRYPIAQYADITINTGTANVTDLKYGQDVTLSIQNGMVVAVSAETFVNPSYIPVNGKIRMGRIETSSFGYITVIYDDQTKGTLLLNELTQIRENGNIVTSSQINPGDRVKIYFSDIYSQTPTKIEIEGPEQLITGIYKGKFFKVNRANKTIVLTQASILKNNQWVSTGEFSMDIQVDGKATIFYNGLSIPFTMLTENMQGMDLYVAIKDSYSKNQAVQVAIKNGGERVYYSGISTLNAAVGRFEMDNKLNINYNDGTIFVRDDRLVTKSALNTDENALIVSNYINGINTASVVELHGISNILHNPYKLYLGHIETVYSSLFTIENGASMTGYSWNEADDDNVYDFSYGDETVITDVTEDDPVTISDYGFFNGSYTREENEDEDNLGLDYERYYAFIVANEYGEALSVMLRKEGLIKDINIDDEIDKESEVEDELNNQINRFVYTKGEVASINTAWQRLEIKNAYDWLDYYEEWNDNRTNVYVEIGDTIIMRNNKQIEFEDVEIGDKIQVVRLNEDAIIVVVE